MYRHQYIEHINTILNSAIVADYPRRWHEDIITADVLSSLISGLKNVTLRTKNVEGYIEWDAYKLNGSEEQAFGDIGLIVRFVDTHRKSYEGVAFIEAKKRFPKSGLYDSWNVVQANHILDNTRHPVLVMYDYEPSNTVRVYKNSFRETADVNVYSMPLDLVPICQNDKSTLENHSTPFAYQLVTRFLSGYDLDYRQDRVSAVAGFAVDRGITKFILSATVSENREVALDNRIVVNTERYRRNLYVDTQGQEKKNDDWGR